MRFIVFILIFFGVYFLVNIYLFVRGWQALSLVSSMRPFYSIVFAVLCLSFIIMMIGEGRLPNGILAVVNPIGATWLAAMLYFTLFVIFIDIIRVINHYIPVFPVALVTNYAKTKVILFFGVVAAVTITCIIGYYRFTHPDMNKLEIKIDKQITNTNELRIVMASDIHLGHMIKQKRLQSYIEKINSLNPDIVLFAGDIIDRDLKYVISEGMGDEFKKIQAKLGVYAVIGNHEYISGQVDKAVQYLQNSGINMLRDTAILVNNSFYIVGRDDRTNPHRKPLSALVDSLNKDLPVILLDHQPSHLEDAEINGINLQLSGHTHNGQLFPLNYITRKVYEVSYGYKKKGNTHVYVSSGLGLWGPPFRIGTKSEIVEIILRY